MLNSKYELIAYANAFVSFILPKVPDVKEIILFGSAARGESAKDSDVDLFFNIADKEKENRIKGMADKELEKFYKSKIAEVWFLRGIKNSIRVNVGKLDEWKLKRSIISDGICLYGKYKETPKGLKEFVLFNLKPIKNIAKRNKVIRQLFGRKEKAYFTEGIIKKLNGRKLSASSFTVSLEYAHQIIKLLGEEKVNYSFFEIWTDQL